MRRSTWRCPAVSVFVIVLVAGATALGFGPSGPIAGAAVAAAPIAGRQTLTTCTQAALQGALNTGGTITVDCSGTIALIAPLTFGGGTATVNATGQSLLIQWSFTTQKPDERLFEISGGHLRLIGLTFKFGGGTGKDGEDGTDGTYGTTGTAGSYPGGTGGDGGDAIDGTNGQNGMPSQGGCFEISSGANVVISNSTMEDCSASGGQGGEGGIGGNGGWGGAGGAGEPGTDTLGNGTNGGAGGNGGNPGNGGNGGNGASGEGGAIYNAGALTLSSDLRESDSAGGGLGNIGGSGGFSGDGGIGGAGGDGVDAGGPGDGGNGGAGGPSGDGSDVAANGGNGGNGAPAYGGAIYNAGSLKVARTTFSGDVAGGGDGSVFPGFAGPGSSASSNGGTGGAGGSGGLAEDSGFQGGDGGDGGGAPDAGPSGNPGQTGTAGIGDGGAIYNTGSLLLESAAFSSDAAYGGYGGNGGDGGGGATGGYGGNGGGGGNGFNGANSGNNGTGGAGGNGTNGTNGTNGASGANANGGAVYSTNTVASVAKGVTFAACTATGGMAGSGGGASTAGDPGLGGTPNGSNGQPGALGGLAGGAGSNGTGTAPDIFGATIPALQITTTSLPSGRLGHRYSATIATSGGKSPIHFSSKTKLPAGIKLDSRTGALSGKPTTVGAVPVTFSVRDSSQPKQTATDTLTIRVSRSTSKTVLKLSKSRATYGDEETEHLSATVAFQPAGTTPTGSVTVKESSTTLCTIRLASGKGSCTLAATKLRPGRYRLTAAYSGNADVANSTSAGRTLKVSKASSKTALKLSSSKVTYGHEKTESLAVTVRPQFAAAKPTGSVTVKESSTTLCTIKLASGKGSCKLSAKQLAAGKYTLVATYGGSGHVSGSSSPSETLTVSKVTAKPAVEQRLEESRRIARIGLARIRKAPYMNWPRLLQRILESYPRHIDDRFPEWVRTGRRACLAAG